MSIIDFKNYQYINKKTPNFQGHFNLLSNFLNTMI